jgi:hypothetical protein
MLNRRNVLQVLTPVLNMSRKGHTTLRIRPTIPYASQTLEIPNIMESSPSLHITLDFPSTILSACNAPGTASTRCEMRIPSFSYSDRHKYNNRSFWYREYELGVYNKDQLGYVIDNSMLLRLKSTGGGENAATVFEGTTLPDIPVIIIC